MSEEEEEILPQSIYRLKIELARIEKSILCSG